jgi:hypothetical protein
MDPAESSDVHAPDAFAPGLYDIDLQTYLNEKAHVSSSMLKRVLESPEALQRYLARRHESAPVLDFGTAVHCALLEPARFEEEYVALPVQRADMFHEADLALINADRQDVHFITEAQMQAVRGICDHVRQMPEVLALLKEGLAERSLFWRDEATGIRCKIRPDLLVLPHLILELKTTFNPSLAVFQRTALMQRYHLSAAMYLDGVEQVTGHRLRYMYLVAGRHAPFEVLTFVPSEAMLREGDRLYRLALTTIKGLSKHETNGL